MNSDLKSKNILIVGMGLIGGSYALKLKQNNYTVRSIDISPDTNQYIKENNITIDNDLTDIEKIKLSDFIIVCLYPSMITGWILENQQYMMPNTFITDVSGIKENIVNVIEDKLRKDLCYISHHPMAGREVSGIKEARSNLFKEANFIIIKSSPTSFKRCDLLKEFATLMEFKYIEVLSVEKHDEIIGFLSQLPHAIAMALVTSHEVKNYITYSGDSFRDLTRIAKINPYLWSELFLNNKKYLVNEIDQFINKLNDIKQDLENNDEQSLQSKMILSTINRKLFDKSGE